MKIGEIVRVVTQGTEGKLCEVRSMLNLPSAELVDEDGHSFHWAQSLTRPATNEETVSFWKNQAEHWKRRAAKHGCNTDEGDPDCA